MIEHILHRYKQEIVAAAERWEHLDTVSERAFLRGIQIGALFVEQRLQEMLDAAKERGDLASALEDQAADLAKRALAEKRAIAEAEDIPTKLGYIKALERGAQDMQAAAKEVRYVECDEVVRQHRLPAGGHNPLRLPDGEA